MPSCGRTRPNALDRRLAGPPLALLCLLLGTVVSEGCASRTGISSPHPPSSISSAQNNLQFPSHVVVAVVYFDDRTGAPELSWVRKGMPDMLVGSLAQVPSLLVVQRERLDEVLKEQTLHLSGRVADDSAIRVGRLTGATVLVTGSVAATAGIVRIDTQLLNVETGVILGTAAAEGPVSDVLNVGRSLAGKVVELFPAMEPRPASATREPGDGFVPAVQANDAGEVLSRKGKLFEALSEFERAMATEPGYSVARSNFSKVVRELTGTELIRILPGEAGVSESRRVVDRLVERLAKSGLRADVGEAQAEAGPQNSVILRIPVRLRLMPEAVEAVVDAARVLGGTVVPQSRGPLSVRLSSQPELSREFVRAMQVPLRAYLRVLDKDGRTIAIYSALRDWRLSSWIVPHDDEHLLVDVERIVETQVLITGLTMAQARMVGLVKLTVDPVPNERATVRLDVLESDSPGASTGPDTPDLWNIRALRPLLEEAWSPVLAVRTWSPGYLPSNQRVAVVTWTVETDAATSVEDPHLTRGSGDADFDQAALEAARKAVERWTHHDRPAVSSSKPASSYRKGRLLKLRAQFMLVKDIPGMNLIGAEDRTRPLISHLASDRR